MGGMRWLYGLGAVALLFGAAFTYVSRSPYERPERLFVEPKSELVASSARRTGGPKVVVLVLDGFAGSTRRAAKTPNLDRMAAEGAHTLDMMPVFPTLSMPNHYSLTTGCYPERHGVVGNHFKDPERGLLNAGSDADWLLQCEPLHVAAERQGVRAAVLSWVGDSSSSRGKLATIAMPYRDDLPELDQHIDRVIELLADPAGPDYIAAYSTHPDKEGHVHGPLARETIAKVEELDVQIGRVMKAIDERGLRARTTLVVTTDHGMVDVKGMLNVDGIVRRTGIDAQVYGEGSIAFVHLADRATKAQALAALSRGQHYDVFDPLDPPAYSRIGTSPRVGDLVIVAHAGYWMADLGFWPWYLRWGSYIGGELLESNRFKGMHGYDPNEVPGVRSLFFAWGGRVREGLVIPSMQTVDVHPTAAHLLAIEPGTPVDGVARVEITQPDAPAAGSPPDAGTHP